MHVPKYWARATWSKPSASHWKSSFVQYGHSDVSMQAAEVMANERLATLIERIQNSVTAEVRQSITSYLEADPLREELIDEKNLGQAHIIWTRNSYGADVMNTDKIMFIDLDFDSPPLFRRVGHKMRVFMGRIFGQDSEAPALKAWSEQPQLAEQQPRCSEELWIINRVLKYCQSHPAFAGRIYRTKVGLRMLVTNDFYLPDSDNAQNIMKALGSDELYVRLCKTQKCFRARLTAKPWRCGFKRHHLRFPYSAEEAKYFQEWHAAYSDKRSAYQACSYLCHVGPTEMPQEIRSCIELHDQGASALGSQPLA